MGSGLSSIATRLPWSTPPLRKNHWLRPALYIAVITVLVLTVVQFQAGTMKNHRRAMQAAAVDMELESKAHKGAIGRWRGEIRLFWLLQQAHVAGDGHAAHRWNVRHPNMPVAVLLMTPFAYLPIWAMALSWNVLKLLAIGAIVLMAVDVARHRQHRMPDWLVFLAVLAALGFFVSDIQHGNTNVFVALAVVGHVWLFRKRQDMLSGAALALGICLKVTPGLFLLYWAYQRQWRVLAGAAVALPLLVLSPAVVTGWSFYRHTMTAWVENLVVPGLSGHPYPVHINQSLPAMVNRYFSGGDRGNYLWDPDYTAEPVEFGWITLVDLGDRGAQTLLRGLQVGMVLLAGWAIGWRRLGRDDGRRGLHYGIVVSMMLLLNQRSWDHHAAYLVLAHVAAVYAIFRGNLSEGWQWATKWLFIAGLVWLAITSGDLIKALFGDAGSERVAAYGLGFWHFLLMWGLCIALAARLRDVPRPFHRESVKDRRGKPASLMAPGEQCAIFP